MLQQDEALTARWQAVLASSAIMADDGRVPPGTRYDALRILPLEGWDRRGAQLARYLARDAHPELQMGAVSGLSDIEAPAAATTLLAALPQLTEPNRRLAIAALCRTPGRRQMLQQALDAQRVDPAWLTAEQRSLLQQK